MPTRTPLITHLLDCSFSTFEQGGFYGASHLHHFHQLDVILDGAVRIELPGTTVIAATRSHAVLHPPLSPHSYESQSGFRQAAFKFHLAPEQWARYGNTPLHAQMPPHLLQNLEDAGARYLENKPLCEEQAAAAATLCLVALLEKRSEFETREIQENALHPKLWPLLEEIENFPFNEWTVATLARRSHLSPDHFARCFFRLLQRTPQRYLLEARMRAAAAVLLREPDLPVKQLAERCSYASVHAFSRAFSSVFHCGPAAYRRMPRDS